MRIKNRLSFLILPFISLVTTLILPQVSYAQDIIANINLTNVQTQGIAANESLGDIIKNAFSIAIVLATVLVLVFLIWGAIDWITSGGEKEKVAGARKKILNALIGLAILALAFFIVTFVGNILDINVLNNFQIPALGRAANGS